tara:strand:+ start:4848 stop:6065 length:1218 start_codon:yes stop_codon:yes gene_type:complete
MNIKQQLLIDKFIAKPVAFLLNFMVRGVGQILSINHDLNKPFKTIAICKFKGMGSIIQATPMLEAIRKKHPEAEIIFVTTEPNRRILTKIDLVDTIVTIDDSNLFKFISTNIKSLLFLLKKRPEVYFDLEIYSDFSTLFTLFSLSTNRVGFYLRSSSFRMGIYTHMMFFNPRVPISQVYLQLTRLIGCDSESIDLYPLTKNTATPTRREKKYLVINPNSSDLRLERRWDKENFINLIRLIVEKFTEYDVLLIGGGGAEKAYTEEISKQLNDSRVINTAGKTSIDEAIDLIEGAELMVTNDTGPMHIAFSLNTEVVCLFGPCSPDQYGMSKNAHIIYKSTYCSPCIHDFEIAPCKGNNVCMKLIIVEEVFEKVSQLLDKETETKAQLFGSQFIYKDESNVYGKVIR